MMKAGDRVVVVSDYSNYHGSRATVIRIAPFGASMIIKVDGDISKLLFGRDEVVLENRRYGGDA